MELHSEKSNAEIKITFSGWIHLLWWISLMWLAFVALVIIYGFVWWFTNADDPARYEAAYVPLTVAVYSLPAGLGVLVAGILPGTRLSPYKRASGIALGLFCVGSVMLFDFLQAKYR